MSTHASKKLSPIALAVRSSIIGLSLAQGVSHAATIQVNNNADSDGNNNNCTLREAVVSINFATLRDACANSGAAFGTNDTVTISPTSPDLSITLSGSNIYISTDMVINASNSLSVSGITVNGNNLSRIFSISNSSDVMIDGINIINGKGEDTSYGGENVGGAIYLKDYSTLRLSNSSLTGNSANDYGGAIYAQSGMLNITNSNLTGNSTNGYGGAIYSTGGNTLTINKSKLSSNSANGFGGAISASGTVLNITNSTLSNNVADRYYGGAISFSNGNVNITDSSLFGNSAKSAGAIYNLYGPLVITNSTLSGNSAIGGEGGAINARGNISIYNSTLSGNSAIGGGGGAINNNDAGSIVTLNNTTLSENAASRGAIYAGLGAIIGLKNSIIGNSIGGADCYLAGGTVNADNYNIIEDGSCGTTALAVDPRLVPLANNGGDTASHALLANSPAINAGDLTTCETFDQRDQLRNDGDGKCDIGAIEYTDDTNFIVIPLSNGKVLVVPN